MNIRELVDEVVSIHRLEWRPPGSVPSPKGPWLDLPLDHPLHQLLSKTVVTCNCHKYGASWNYDLAEKSIEDFLAMFPDLTTAVTAVMLML